MGGVYSTSREDFDKESTKLRKEALDKSKHFNILIQLVKDKIKTSRTKDPIKLLTLAPATWSIEKLLKKYYKFSGNKTQNKYSQQSLLGIPQKKHGKTLEKDSTDLVHQRNCKTKNE